MKPVRIGVIGIGNIGAHHVKYLQEGKIAGGQVTAVAAASQSLMDPFKDKGLKLFVGGEPLIASGEVDAVIIATPHFQHAPLSIAAFAAGLHVMVEKPIAAHKADAERMIAARRRRPDLVFGGMFQMRTESRYIKIKKMIADGELGEIVRFSWIITEWFRTEAYYSSSEWRATWKGEGGGVLINQCLHQLDMVQWLLGMPARVRSFLRLGRFHDIETEDDVTSYWELANGAPGTFITSTGEAPGTNRLEISGTKGKVLLEHDKLTWFRNAQSMVDVCKTAKLGFQKPECEKIDLPIPLEPSMHAAVTQNFVNAILKGEPLIAPGEEGIHSIELANALLYSGLINQSVELPLDGAVYEAKLNDLIAGSTRKKTVVRISNEDFTKSFMR